MLRYKITPPVLVGSVRRPRLLDVARDRRSVALAAPAGHGKTCLAAQLAEVLPGPTAWFSADELDRDLAGVASQILAALARAWPDLSGLAPAPVDDDAALPLLGAAMETLAGPGCLVIDDAHRMPAAVFDAVAHTAFHALPPECRLVVCTREQVPEPLVRAEAAGVGVTFGPDDLVFTAEECAELNPLGSTTGADLHARTGGWPLAVALSAEATRASSTPGPPPPGPDPEPPTSATQLPGPADRERNGNGHGRSGSGLRHASVLTEVALGDLPGLARDLLATLARLPRFPVGLLAAVGDDARVAVQQLARRHPSIIQSSEDGWWAMREWLRDTLGGGPVAPEVFTAVAESLRRSGERELLVHLLTDDGRHAEAVPDVEALAVDGARQQRWGWVRALIAVVPAPLRTLELDLLAARAAHSLNLVWAAALGPHVDDVVVAEALLVDLVERTAAVGTPAQALRARVLLADHYRWSGDARVLDVCEAALGDVLAADDPVAGVEARLARWSPDEAEAAATIMRLYGLALMLSADGTLVTRGRRLLDAALLVIDAHRGNLSERLWLTYIETMVWLRPVGDAVAVIRPGARRMQELHQFDAGLRLAELAILEHFAGEPAHARHSLEVARECADRSGHIITDTPLEAIGAVLDVAEHGLDPGRAAHFDDMLTRLAEHPRLRRFTAPFAAEMAVVLVGQGDLEAARRYLDVADASVGATLFAHVASLSCRRSRVVLLLAAKDPAGVELLDDLYATARAEQRPALIEQLDRDRIRFGAAASAPTAISAAATATATATVDEVAGIDVAVGVLGPVLEILIAGEPSPAPRGYPAKLLALLVAARGIMTVDAAIEGLWPGADPDLGRNRLYGVLLRLRRGLGLPVDGPITCIDGLVRLEARAGLTVDAWTFEQAERHPGDALDAALLYTGDVLSEQFAYDDTVESYRADLRRRFLTLAEATLATTPDDAAHAPRRAALARRIHDLES